MSVAVGFCERLEQREPSNFVFSDHVIVLVCLLRCFFRIYRLVRVQAALARQSRLNQKSFTNWS